MLNALDSLHAIAQVLIGFRILDDDLSLSVDRQDQRITGFLEAFEEFRSISLKGTERPNVVGNVQQGLTNSASNSMIPRRTVSVNRQAATTHGLLRRNVRTRAVRTS
jgi:hypothetical protein